MYDTAVVIILPVDHLGKFQQYFRRNNENAKINASVKNRHAIEVKLTKPEISFQFVPHVAKTNSEYWKGPIRRKAYAFTHQTTMDKGMMTYAQKRLLTPQRNNRKQVINVFAATMAKLAIGQNEQLVALLIDHLPQSIRNLSRVNRMEMMSRMITYPLVIGMLPLDGEGRHSFPDSGACGVVGQCPRGGYIEDSVYHMSTCCIFPLAQPELVAGAKTLLLAGYMVWYLLYEPGLNDALDCRLRGGHEADARLCPVVAAMAGA